LEVSGQLHAAGEEPPGIHCIGGWVGPPQGRSGRCGEEKNLALPGIELGPSSPYLYRLLNFGVNDLEISIVTDQLSGNVN
jgi:hypothetical protein